MTDNKVAMSLDEIIKSSKRNSNQFRGTSVRGRGRGRGRARGNGRKPFLAMNNDSNSEIEIKHVYRGGYRGGGIGKARFATRSSYFARRPNLRSNDAFGTTKLLISNLHYGVTLSDIRMLFIEFGQIVSVKIHYDKSGRSSGSAEVVFKIHENALTAMKSYNNVRLDGRPMTIQIVLSEIPSRYRYFTRSVTNKQYNESNSEMKAQNKRFNSRRTTKSEEELDAELELYNSMQII